MTEFKYDIKDIKKLKLSSASADMTVQPTNDKEITAKVDTDETGYQPFIDKSENTLTIRFQKSGKGFLENIFRKNNVVDEVFIQVPRSILELQVNTASGDIIVEDFDLDSLKVTVVSGDLRIEDTVSPDFSCNSVSGDVIIRNCNFRSFSGNSVSGDIFIENLPPLERDLWISTVSGDARIIYTGKPKLEAVFSSVSGEIITSAPMTKRNKKHYRFYHEHFSGEEANEKLKIQSVSGDLLLNVHETGVSGTSFKTPPRKISHEEKESRNREFESLIIDEETEKTLNLLKEGKLTEEYTRKFLQVMGYKPEEVEYLLKLNYEEEQDEELENDSEEQKDTEETEDEKKGGE
ncbi:MAG: DUF4097 family beta strand repeat-containing protein [Thermotogota bacterium]|nr:DUF4097 family beta strand repeat-containing protein [Thermotogota bacterium]